MKEPIIGIDLGTTNSEVAIVAGENTQSRVTVIDITMDSKILPSFVGLADDGALLVGETAKNQYVVYPERTVKSIKRKMGLDYSVTLGARSYTPPEISAIILKRLKQIAENAIGQPVNKAVITVPAYFSDAQRQATREAGEIAGLEVVRMINEPTAAALSYGAARQEKCRILVYDLGGGTFDVSVVSVENGVIEVLASHGDNHLGGDDFDQKLVEHIIDSLEDSGTELSLSERTRATINRAAERAKIELSDHPFATVEEEYLLNDSGRPIHLSLEIAREDYESMIEPFIDRTLEAVHTALNGAELSVADIDEVLLVGGASRTPVIGRRLRDELGLNVRAEINPDLCVATGAAIQAAMLAGEDVSAVLVDITPYTFGTSAFGELDGLPYPYVYVPVIQKNSPIPVTKSEAFYTMHDGQEAVIVDIYQGEAPDAQDNINIGSFRVENLSDVPAGNTIVLELALNLDGILQVSAREKSTGLQKSITIANAMSNADLVAIDSARERIEKMFEHVDAPPEVPARAEPPPSSAGGGVSSDECQKADELIDRAQRLAKTAAGDDQEDIVDLIEALRGAVQAGDGDALASAYEQLTDIVFYLES